MVFNVLEDSCNVTMAVDLVIAGRQSVMFYDSTFCSFKQKALGGNVSNVSGALYFIVWIMFRQKNKTIRDM